MTRGSVPTTQRMAHSDGSDDDTVLIESGTATLKLTDDDEGGDGREGGSGDDDANNAEIHPIPEEDNEVSSTSTHSNTVREAVLPTIEKMGVITDLTPRTGRGKGIPDSAGKMPDGKGLPRPVRHVVSGVEMKEATSRASQGRRLIGSSALLTLDPFLLFDHIGPSYNSPGAVLFGSPDQNSVGYEGITYMMEGSFNHVDSAGHTAVVEDGDVQWVFAGKGLVQSDLPTDDLAQLGGRIHAFQLWLNVSEADRAEEPMWKLIKTETIPEVMTSHRRALIRVISGTVGSVTNKLPTRSPLTFLDIRLQPGGHVTVHLEEGFTGFVYIYDGKGEVGASRVRAEKNQMVVLESLAPGDTVPITASLSLPGMYCLFVGSRPLYEAPVRFGSCVMPNMNSVVDAVAPAGSASPRGLEGESERFAKASMAYNRRTMRLSGPFEFS